MNYLPITPVGLLPAITSSGSKNVFILSHLWKILAYRNFYMSNKWNTVIIDNDLYEKESSATFDDMEAIADSLNATRIFIVGPEVIGSGMQTAKMTQEILKERESNGFLYLTDKGANVFLMAILHERPNEIACQWNILKQYKQLGIGISIFSFRLGYDRGSLLRMLRKSDDNRYFHAFGWDNLLEAHNMASAGFNSVDSSIASTAAANNIELFDNWQITRDPGRDGVLASTRLPLDAVDVEDLHDDTVMNISKIQQFLNSL